MADPVEPAEPVQPAPPVAKTPENFFDQFDDPKPIDAPQPVPQVKPEAAPQKNIFDQFDNDPDAKEPGLFERARLNATEAYYRGTLRGSADLAAMASIALSKDETAKDSDPIPWGMNPFGSITRKELRDKYEGTIADLARYDAIRPWGDSVEGIVSLGAQFAGSLPSPESLVGWAAKGGTAALRTAQAALKQAEISLVADPVVQYLSKKGGTQTEYDPVRTILAGSMGAIIGGGLHIGGELISAGQIRRMTAELGAEDPQFKKSGDIESEAAPKTETSPGPTPPAPMPIPEGPPPGFVRLYRGETSGEAPAGRGMNGGWFTTDLEKAKLYGDVSYVDIPKDDKVMWSNFAQGHGGPDEFVTDSDVIKNAARQLNQEQSSSGTRQTTIARGQQEALQPAATDELALAARAKGGTLAMERQRPDTGISTGAVTGKAGLPATIPEAPSSPAQESSIRSLQQQSMDLAEALDIPLRQGRVTSRKALGVYKSDSGVIRVREVPDFEVVSHEAGHAIEAKAGKDLTDLTNHYSSELAPLVSNPSAYDPSKHVQEGFAEYIRRYIGNPAHAEQVAPGFTIAFRDFMGKNHPDVLAAIDKASSVYQSYLNAPSVDAVGAVVRSRSDEATGWRGVVERIREDGFPATIKTVIQRGYEALLDDKAPVAMAVRDLARAIRDQTGQLTELKHADNPEVLLRMFHLSQQAGLLDMRHGIRPYHQIEPEGPSLSDALTKATGQHSVWGTWDPELKSMFSTYLVARRAEVLWGKFETGKIPRPPAAFSKGDAVTAWADLEREHPQFREASQMVHDYSRQLLTKQFDGGLIPADVYERLLKEEFYVPFMRDLSDRPLQGGQGSSPQGPGMTETVKKLKGSSRDIIDPIESLMTQTFLVDRTLAHNDIIRAFVRLGKRAGDEGGAFVEKIPAKDMHKYTFDLGEAVERAAKEHGLSSDEARALAGSMSDVMGDDPIRGSFFRAEPTKPKGEPIVFYKEGGELRAARFMSRSEGRAIYEALTAMPSHFTELFSDLIARTSAVMRGGVITEPMFAVTNYIRDQFAASILRPDYIPILSGVRGIVDEFMQRPSSELYAYAGGVAPGASIAPLERAAESQVDALAKQGYILTHVTSLKGIFEFVQFSEAGTRNSVFGKVFDAKKAQGLSDYEAMIEAAYTATDLLDFGRHGSHTLMVRAAVPFFNAHFQGLDKARRALIDPLLQKLRGDQVLASDPEAFRNAMLGMTKVFGLSGVMGFAWAALNWEKEAYRDANPYLTGTHVVVPVGRNVFLWPKPFELGVGFTAGEYAYAALVGSDPRAAGNFANAAWQAIEPPNPLSDIPLLKTFVELKTGKSMFTGREIVPPQLQRLAPQEQFTDTTSFLAKMLGKQTGLSPIKIDYTIGNMFGTWGRDVMALSQGVDENAPAANWEDRVFLRRLIKDPSRTSDVTTKFWGFMGQTSGQFNQDVATYDSLVKGFREGDAKNFIEKLPPSERAWVTLKSAADEDGKPAFKAEQTRLHPLQRAYDAVSALNGLRHELSANAFKNFETPDEGIKLDPITRRDVIDNIRELAQVEMRNAFVMMKEPGYANRPLIDPQTTMDKIRALSPQIADEVAARYATAKVYATSGIASPYQKLQSTLLRDGGEADLGDLVDNAESAGYEFGGERVKKPPKRRIQIQPSAR